MSDEEMFRGGDLRPYPGSNWGKPPERPAPPLSRADLERHFRLLEKDAGMTDMRATERLLEVLHELAGKTNPTKTTNEILAIVTELRRRGDTLVRRDDLRLVIEAWNSIPGLWFGDEHEAAMERIENALGGKMR